MSAWECRCCGLQNTREKQSCQACFTKIHNPRLPKQLDQMELLVMGWIRLFIDIYLSNIPIECKSLCKDFCAPIIDSKILAMNEEKELLKYVQMQTKTYWNWTLIYRATEHGFADEDFYDHCREKGNTVVIIHNEYDRVFGGYTPCVWRQRMTHFDPTVPCYVQDETEATFLFILRPNGKRKMINLKSKKVCAITRYYGIAFDFGDQDLWLCDGKVYTAKLSRDDSSFDWKGKGNQGYFYGETSRGNPLEIEIYQLTEI